MEGFLGRLAVFLVVATVGCAERRAPAPVVVTPVATTAPTPTPATEPVRVPALGPGQYRVCAFSFHSPDELAAIEAELPADEFVFTDLSPVFVGRSTRDWFLDRCRSDLSCDVAIFSGEFADAFFGDYGYSVTVQELEEASCQARCAGLFRDPREVFLLACNTLATKNADHRTPEEYLNVLLLHGFSHADAQRVVAVRYGPFGASFRQSLRRMFMGVPRIYGFSSVAPRGVVTAPMLRNYFRSKGDYAQYLERVGRDPTVNRELLAAFSGTSLVQTSGVAPFEPTAGDRALVCALYDEGETVSDRLRVVHRLFSRDDFLSFLPTVGVFLDRHPPERYDHAERRLLAKIQSLETPRREVTELLQRMGLSVLKMQMANLARQLSWITPAEHERIAAESLKELLAEPLSSEVADIGCELGQYVPTGTALRAEDIPEQLLWHAEGYRLLDCLSPSDPAVSYRMLSGLENIDDATRVWAVYALWKRRPLDDRILTAMAARLNDPSADVRDRVRRVFEAAAPLSPGVLAAVQDQDAALAHKLQTAGGS